MPPPGRGVLPMPGLLQVELRLVGVVGRAAAGPRSRSGWSGRSAGRWPPRASRRRSTFLHLLAVEQVLHAPARSPGCCRARVLAHDQVGVAARPWSRRPRSLACRLTRSTERGSTAPTRCTSPDSSALTRAVSSGMPMNSISSRYGLARLPVVLVAHGDRAHAGLELLDLVGAGADAGVEVGRAVLDDEEVVGAEDHRQVGVRRRRA